MKRVMILMFLPLSEHWEKGYARFTEGKSQLQWLETFYNVARQLRGKPAG
ncbi:hypothetical protein ACLB1T_10335 [Escherichia coli]